MPIRSALAYVLRTVCGRQQRLRRNATTIEAGASQRFVAFDERHRFAELRGTQCRGISSWPRSDDDNVEMLFSHACPR